MSEKLEELYESYINGNISLVCDEVRKLDNEDLCKILNGWVDNGIL